MTRALIAMSGGVDSSVAAALMRERGYDCVGVTMRLFREEDAEARRAARDAEDAAAVAARLGMPHFTLDCAEAFRERVIDRFARAYLAGRTPNPCIDCNRRMKFALLLDQAKALGCEVMATGHYARLTDNPETGRRELRKGLDAAKDQSYVLHMLTQEQLGMLRFPLGDLEKPQVRLLAERYGFANAGKGESQDICFVPDGRYADFIERHTGEKARPGNFVDVAGRTLGRHRGIVHYTVGQRRGLGIPAAEPYYVKAIRAETNEVVLAGRGEIGTVTLLAEDFNWTSIPEPEGAIPAKVKVRYRQREAAATAHPLAGNRARIVFAEPLAAVATGQAAVLYAGDLVLGGGTIAATE